MTRGLPMRGLPVGAARIQQVREKHDDWYNRLEAKWSNTA
jgi:hypothetical protein